MTKSRILLDVAVEPAIGSRFQPTGFPDLGAAVFTRPGGSQALLVESAQSMANRLEGVAWDTAENRPAAVMEGLPYIRVVTADGAYLTSSRTEAHRLASAFIKDSTRDGDKMVEVIKNALGLKSDRPLDHRAIARALFKLDPFVLLHGVFFADSKWPGQPKVARAISAFIEASDTRRAESGGVKRDQVRHSIEEGRGGSSEGYGSVPFSRTEWTAEEIIASFSIDLRQLRSYGLPEAATELLTDMALWEIRVLLEDGLRLRTACDFVPVSNDFIDKAGDAVPPASELSARIRSGIAACADLLEDVAVLEVVWDGGAAKKKDS